jgi:hypothetical protein
VELQCLAHFLLFQSLPSLPPVTRRCCKGHAMDDYFGFIQKTLSSDLLEKMKTYTEQNILASVECANKLSRVRNFQEICRIQTEFMQTQWNSFGEQAKSLGETYTKAAAAAMKAIPFNMSS